MAEGPPVAGGREAREEREAREGRRSIVREFPWVTPDRAQRAAAGGAVRQPVQHAVRDQPARTAALVRHAPARARGRPARHPGTPRPRAALDDAAVYARQ